MRQKKAQEKQEQGMQKEPPYCVYGITKDSCMHCNQLVSSGGGGVVQLSVVVLFQLHWKPLSLLLDASLQVKWQAKIWSRQRITQGSCVIRTKRKVHSMLCLCKQECFQSRLKACLMLSPCHLSASCYFHSSFPFSSTHTHYCICLKV